MESSHPASDTSQRQPEQFSRLLNASGFAFQPAIEAAVKAAPCGATWKVEAREHPWATQSASGYIDLVVSNGQSYLAVEAKRTRDATWMFLMYDETQRDQSRATIRWTNTLPHRPPLADWDDIQIYPASREVDFCVIRGQGERDAPLVERIASAVAQSAEGLAAHLLEITEQISATRLVIPVIVTNANLVVASFKPEDVDLTSGDVEQPSFTTVQHLRFRKGLADAESPDYYEPENLRDLSAAAERTVFVVNSSHFTTWLEAFQINLSSAPWQAARQRAGD